MGADRHCRIAELTALICLAGCVLVNERDELRLKFVTENARVARKCFTLLEKTFNIYSDVCVRQRRTGRRTRGYLLLVRDPVQARRILDASKLLHDDGRLDEDLSMTNRVVIMMDCCKRAYLRGAFLAAGSVNDPEKSYHLELVCDTLERAELIHTLIQSFHLDAGIVPRKKHYIVYVKEAEAISDFLNLIGAHVALMKFENVRILKEISNTVNRQVNCETANLNRTVTTAVKQMEDIRYIASTIGLEALSDPLADMARVRLENPSVPLKNLGPLLTPPVGKSGVNHRLRKLSEIAESLRGSGSL